MRVMATICLLLSAQTAAAHSLLENPLSQRLPLLLSAVLLGAAWVLYGLGARRVRPHGLEALWLHLAMLIAVFAVFGPLDDWAETSTSWHMLQHMLFILVIAPLWALARPLPVCRCVGW